MRRTQILAMMILFGSQLKAWGHPGHGNVDASSPLHYLAEPAHQAAGLVMLIVALITLAYFLLPQQRVVRRRSGM